MTEAQKKAQSKYLRTTKQIVLRYKASEMEDYKAARSLGSVAIKNIIRRSYMRSDEFMKIVECWVVKYSNGVDTFIELFASGNRAEAEQFAEERCKQYKSVEIFKSLCLEDRNYCLVSVYGDRFNNKIIGSLNRLPKFLSEILLEKFLTSQEFFL